MQNSSGSKELQELKSFQKSLTAEQALKMVNEAVEARIRALGTRIAGSNIAIKLDIAMPW